MSLVSSPCSPSARHGRAACFSSFICRSSLSRSSMTQNDFLRDHGCHKGTSQPWCCAAGNAHHTDFNLLAPCGRRAVADGIRASQVVRRNRVLEKRIRSAESASPCAVLNVARPAMGQMRPLSCAWPPREGGEPLARGVVESRCGLVGACVIPCPGATCKRRCDRPRAPRGKRTSSRVTVATRL